MSTSREEQLDALAVQLREAAYFCTKLEDLEIHCEKVAAELARLAATPKAGVDIRPLDWQKTFVDRGDGSKDQSGWEADNGFNGWYSIEMYFGSDSYGWSVQFDTDVIGDFDDPDQAKAAAQKHFEQRISLALLPSVLGGVDQESIATKPTTDPTVASGTEISGWKLVPVRATRAMTLAACDVLPSCEHVFGWAGKLSANVYERMLEAAPSHEGGGDA